MAKHPDFSDCVKIGDELRGKSDALYRILDQLGVGGFGATYLAQRVDAADAGLVVIKAPRLDMKRPPRQISERVHQATERSQAESTSLERLHDVPCVAHVVDVGIVHVRVGDVTIPAFFVVQEFVKGVTLKEWLATRYKNAKEKVSGIREEREWFQFAYKLALAVAMIHEREVLHGDLWPENILVTPNGDLKLIDFGESSFEDFTFEGVGSTHHQHCYAAPERRDINRRWHHTADMYSIGAILFLLATGIAPPDPIRNNDALKVMVAALIKEHNLALYRQNPGIADIIARCLRYSPTRRTPHAESLMQELALFNRDILAMRRSEDSQLAALIRKFTFQSNPELCIFEEFLEPAIHDVVRQVKKLKYGLFESTASQECTAFTLSKLLLSLEAGDSFFAFSTPGFWHPYNLGIRGRYLTANDVAARRGVRIARVLMVNDADAATDKFLSSIVTAHCELIDDLKDANIQVDNRTMDGPGFYTGFVRVTADGTHDEWLHQQKYRCAVCIRRNQPILVCPSYIQDDACPQLEGRINQLRFWTKKADVGEYIKAMERLLQMSVPLQGAPWRHSTKAPGVKA